MSDRGRVGECEAMSQPRMAPMPESEWSPEAAELLVQPVSGWEEASVSTFLATMARHPKLFRRWVTYSVGITRRAQLPEREREIVILRTGWVCQGAYEWGHHVQSARRAGLSA